MEFDFNDSNSLLDVIGTDKAKLEKAKKVLEKEDKLCSSCLERLKESGTSKGIFCKICWERETRQKESKKQVKQKYRWKKKYYLLSSSTS
ncbi:MAG: hypothetical protein MRERC_11c037 [Mycoplasmataceae bacterium RC_NB112A]|nr:MAG: hypothetical protein MRERC_11c037 [Mycoplasmataceae bacterium RC_NB112A]